MIIKSKSYKSESTYATLVNYCLKEQELDGGFVLTRFIKGKNPEKGEIIAQFEKNETFRLHKRKNNVKLYMDILSFHKDDAQHLSNVVLKKIARKYISLRSNLSVAVATIHRHEKEQTHLHILLSGTEYKSGRSVRISKSDFRDKVKVPIEHFVRENFPEIERSAIDHHKKSPIKLRIKDAEYQMNRRGKSSDKQVLIMHLEDIYKIATSERDFYRLLQKENLQLYGNKNGYRGVKLNRKYRFSTLGYTKEILQSLTKDLSKSSRLLTLEGIRKVQEKQRSKELSGRERTRKRGR